MTDEYDPIAKKLHNTTDAQVWAEEFRNTVPGGDLIDEYVLITWFANAIETGRMHH